MNELQCLSECTKCQGQGCVPQPFSGEALEKGAGVSLLCSLQAQPWTGQDPLASPADPLAVSPAVSGGVGTECFVGSAGMW